MLCGLKIENIAVIESACLDFTKGLNVLTGETGTGKSIVIDSINAVLGERTSKDLIRTGSSNARVVATFSHLNSAVKNYLYEMGANTEDNSLTIVRSISLSGNNICKVNGVSVTVTQLKQLGNLLINIHGQHDSQALLSPEKHCGFIDLMAENQELKSEYKEAFSSLIKVKKDLDNLYDTRDEKMAKLDYLSFVIDEITGADIRVGESEELSKEKALIQNAVFVNKSLDKAYASLSGEEGLAQALMECSDTLEKASVYYSDAVPTSTAIKNLAFELEEQTKSVRALSDSFTYKPERLAEIDERLDLIYRLSMKYGKTEQDILDTLEKSVAEKAEIDVFDANIAKLEKQLYDYSDKVKALAEKLTKSRKRAAEKFQKQVEAELCFLDMPYVKFSVDFKEVPLTSKGAENIEFLISANPGQEPKPISKIASGGELSRIMLAIKNTLSDKDDVDTLIFDEIDSGVSGSAAEKVALKLYEVSKGRQVICVTHLARIAAQADTHIRVEKEFEDNKTYTKVAVLDLESRAQELARITAGTGITELQLETAREMILKAKEKQL